ncbi:MAG: PH domain-containing protein [Euryarchaeota archaeon]|nr:PH domain-containing protein [Euryarchaeota archaeon]
MDGEVPLRTVRPSPRLLVGEVVQALAVVGVTLAVSAAMTRVGIEFVDEGPPWGPPTFGLGAVTLELVYLGPRIFLAWVQVQFTDYVLTPNRIYSRTEFFSTDLKVLPYEKVTLLTLRRGFFSRLLGYAELDVMAYGAGAMRMRGIRDPVPMFDLARERIRVHNTAEAIVRSD